MKPARRLRLTALFLAVWLLFAAACGKGQDVPDAALSERIGNAGEVVLAIRRGLRHHAKTITITFDYGGDIFGELNGVIDAWVEQALAETDAPDEGDYLRYQYGGYVYSSSYTVADGRWRYTVKLTPDYYCYLSQEEKAADAAEAVLRELSLGRRATDYEKVRAVYDYLCRNVRYDKVHRKNPYNHTKSTAYAALVLRNATCQGYCVSLYRLLRMAGISCRIVTGTAAGDQGEELHAWVIASVDGAYYNLDPTWDAGSESYRFFLLGEDEFTDHVRGEKFLTEAFLSEYPMAASAHNLSE